MIFLSTVMDEERLTLTTQACMLISRSQRLLACYNVQLSTAQGPMGIAYAG